MQDLKARFEKLTTDAADCEMIANLAADHRKRAAFSRLASQYRKMAEAIKAEIDARTEEAGHPSVLAQKGGG